MSHGTYLANRRVTRRGQDGMDAGRPAQTASFPAPGKLNLMLRVIGRRADGYHLLQTVFRFIDYGDTVTVARARGRRHRARPTTSQGSRRRTDLTLRAARLLQRVTGTRRAPPSTLREAAAAAAAAWAGAVPMLRRRLLALNQLWETRPYAGGASRPRRSNWGLMCRSSCSGRTRLPKASASA